MTVTTRTAAQAIAYLHAAGFLIVTEDQDAVWADYLNSRGIEDRDILPAVRLAISRASAHQRQRVTVGDVAEAVNGRAEPVSMWDYLPHIGGGAAA